MAARLNPPLFGSYTEMIDVSQPLGPGVPAYPGDPKFSLEVLSRIGEDGATYNLTRFSSSSHSGTHFDAPAHFIPDGATIDMIPGERFFSPCLVIETSGERPIDAEMIDRAEIEAGGAVLFKTSQSNYDPLVCHGITMACAELLINRGVNIVGIDRLSIESSQDPSYPVHRAILSNNILILEMLRLETVTPGQYYLTAFPLRTEKAEGAPARAFLLR